MVLHDKILRLPDNHSAPTKNPMIIEQRTYDIKPGKLAAYLKTYETKGKPVQWEILGTPVGWYVSNDIGELSQVVHMWQYASLDERAARRAKLSADPRWQAYLADGLDHVQTMRNKILAPAPFFPGK